MAPVSSNAVVIIVSYVPFCNRLNRADCLPLLVIVIVCCCKFLQVVLFIFARHQSGNELHIGLKSLGHWF